MSNSQVAIIIPTRLGSTRLKRKALLEFAGKPMVMNVADRAIESGAGDVYIASADQEIADICQAEGYNCVVTDPKIQTGTDRVYATMQKLDKQYDYIVNLQGDLPSISPESIKAVVNRIINNDSDIATLVTIANTEKERIDPNMVRAIFTESGRALYFTRASNCPHGEGDHYHHVGIYAFTRAALERFVNLPQSQLEKREKLEQLRALENGMTISVEVVDDFAHGVDTAEDYQIVKNYMEA